MIAKCKRIFDKKILIMGIALLVFMGGFIGFSTIAYAAGETVVVANANEQNITVAASQSVFIAPNIQLNNFGFQISSAKLVIENLPNDATITYTNVSGLSVSYDSDKLVYTITGTADASAYQTLFRSFKINSGTTLRNDIKFNFLVSENTTTPMYYSGTGHYYEYISKGAAPIITWTDAAAAASAKTYNGMEGYLVTIMSEGENTFTINKMSGSGWIGISDADADGSWYWSTGPEAGTYFWQGYYPGAVSSVGGYYNNWYPNEPNKDDAAGNYGHLFVNSLGWEAYRGYWNDMPDSNTFVQGYVVEYGGMPEDAPEDFDETVTVNIGASVTYNANGATSGTAPTDNNSPYTSGSNVTVLTNSGTLEKTGYTFTGWNTQANGQGTHYAATGSDTFTISSNVTLYAEWGCSVTYNSNGATSGTVPTDNNSPYSPNSNVTVLTNSGTLERSGYTFGGWNTQADGQGTHYSATGSDSFTISSDVTLYAEWRYSVTYNSNNATSGSVPTDNSSPYSPGSTVTVLTNSGTLAKTGYTFDGWNTQANGQGTHYDATGLATFTVSSNITLYAQWSCSVTYDSNNATSGSVPTDNSSPYSPGSTVTVLTNSGTLAKTGFTFTGWNTQADGQGTHYAATGLVTFEISSNVTLYAEWGCSVTYNANDATSGSVPTDNNSPYSPGTTVTVLTNSGALAKTGFTFSGWNTQADGQGTHYAATGLVTFEISSNVTLYAQWDCSVTYNANNATSGSVPTDNNSPYSPGTTVTVLTNSGALEKTGFTFNGWNTQADGQGTHYDATGLVTFEISSNVTLYAQWDCSVTYNENNATSGTVPTDNNSPYSPGSTVTVLTNSGTLEKTGYTFSGWNTQADGQGTHYDATGLVAFEISSNVTLYAEWGCSVTYNSNNATGGTVPTDANSPYSLGTTVTVLTNSGTLVKTGFTFTGWNTQADGQGTHYDATGLVTFEISSNVTLYAEWLCSVTYNANNATGGTVPTDNNSPYNSGSTVAVLTNSGTLEKTGYIFDGWNTQADGQGTHYDDAGFDSFVISSNVILYAEWARDTDYDGVSDDDEVSAGTNPNDPQDRPQKGTITVTVYQQDGSPAEGFTCVLNSTPVILTTDANGSVEFAGVYLAPHTLTLRNGTEQLGTYSLYFTKGPANSTDITDNASTDSDGSVNTIVASNFLRLNLTIQCNESNFWELGEAGYIQSVISSANTGRVENPQTGDYRTYFDKLWMLAATVLIGGCIISCVALKKKSLQ